MHGLPQEYDNTFGRWYHYSGFQTIYLAKGYIAMYRRRLSITVSLTLIIILSALPSFAWKFVSIADSRGNDNGVNTVELTKIVDKINLEGADLVLFQGDAVGGSSDDTILSKQIDTWLSVMKKLKCPWYYTPGNHEVSTEKSAGILRKKIYKRMGITVTRKDMAYSFNHKNAHFAVLNSDQYGDFHRVQKAWLLSDISKINQPHVFVMAHDPAYPAGPHMGSSLDAYPAERDNFWRILGDASVKMYFCGHEHLYQRSKHGKTYQIINGSCGAPIYHTPGTIAKYQYVVVDIKGDVVNCKTKDDNGGIIDMWNYTVKPKTSTQTHKLLYAN